MQGGAVASLSAVTEIDFDWPRIFWNGLSEQDQQNLIRSVPSPCCVSQSSWTDMGT